MCPQADSNPDLLKEEERTKDAGTFPKVILLDTISYCNLKCAKCGYPLMTREKGKMDMKLFRRIIDEIAEKDKTARVWMVFVGEALMLKHQLFWQILYAKRKGLEDVVLNSNGNLLDEEACNGLIESGLDAIYVGIDASTAETYSKLRVGGNFERTVANVNNLLDLKRKIGVSKPEVFVQYVITEDNEGEVEDFKNYWMGKGALVKIRPQTSWAGTIDPWNIKPIHRHACYWVMRTLNICWDGRVVLCSADYDAKFVAGDITRDSIQSVWLTSLKNMRDLHLKGNYDSLPAFCRDCTDWQMAKANYW